MFLAFYKARGTWFDRLIRFVTRSPYSHVEVAITQQPDGRWLCGSSSVRDGGVRLKAIALSAENWDLRFVGGDANAVRAWFEARAGERYDWLGVLRFVLPFVGQSSRRWFCSEACLAALGLPEPWRFAPAEAVSVAVALGMRAERT
jgi:hypothetical protein